MSNNFMSGILIFLIVAMIAAMTIFGIRIYCDISDVATVDENTIENASEIEIKENIETPQVVEQEISGVESAFSNNVQYSNSNSSNHYFYDQLEDTSKKIYDGLESNIDNMKSGTYQVEFGTEFSDILSEDNGQQVLGDYYQSAIEAFTYDNPDVFYLDPTKMYLNIQTTTKGNKKTYSVYIGTGDSGNYLADGFNSSEQINECQSQIEETKDSVMNDLSGSTYDKIKQIHDYLVDNITYDQTIQKNNIYNLYGALANKECVCEGYAKAFKYLTNAAGIESVIVVGTGTNSKGETENHSWNYVKVNGNWYAVDTTWDDPIVQGGFTLSSSYKYKYFLKGSNTMSKDHFPSQQFTQGGKSFNYPDINSSDF